MQIGNDVQLYEEIFSSVLFMDANPDFLLPGSGYQPQNGWLNMVQY